MQTRKRIVSLLLCALLLTAFVPCVHAAPKNPVVFVAGYTSSRMYLNRGTPEETRVWKQKIADKVVAAIKAELPLIALDAAGAAAGQFDPLFDKLEPYVNEIIEPLRMNDDGSSKYPVEVYPHSVADTRLDKLKEIGYYPDHDSLVMLGDAAGSKNVYCCTLDWRLGQIDNAAVLDRYIRDVLSETGAKKVDLMGVSFGGQVVGSYLALYGGDAVDRVTLQCPALDGSSIVPQLLSGEKFTVAWADAAQLYRAFSKDERDFVTIAELVSPSFLDQFLRAFIDRYFIDFFVNFGSVWDLVPQKDYPALRDKLLRDGKHDEIIRKSDRYHTEVSAKTAETLRALSDTGVRIAIVAGYGSALAVDNGNDSDCVIDVASTTGASSVAKGAMAPGRYLSPDGTLNASSAYLPERTWLVRGLLHSMGANEVKVAKLMTTLLLTDEIESVRSSPAYPQFLSSENPCQGVFCAFGGCAEGYFTKHSVTLRVVNLSEKDSITVDGISCKGADLRFGFARGVELKPGESLTASVSGVLPEKAYSAADVTVDYVVYQDKLSIGKNCVQSFRYADDEMLEEVQTDDATDEVIADTPAVRSGSTPLRAFFGRVLGWFVRVLTAMRRLMRLPLQAAAG